MNEQDDYDQWLAERIAAADARDAAAVDRDRRDNATLRRQVEVLREVCTDNMGDPTIEEPDTRNFAQVLRHLSSLMADKRWLTHMATPGSTSAGGWADLLVRKAQQIEAALAATAATDGETGPGTASEPGEQVMKHEAAWDESKHREVADRIAEDAGKQPDAPATTRGDALSVANSLFIQAQERVELAGRQREAVMFMLKALTDYGNPKPTPSALTPEQAAVIDAARVWRSRYDMSPKHYRLRAANGDGNDIRYFETDTKMAEAVDALNAAEGRPQS